MVVKIFSLGMTSAGESGAEDHITRQFGTVTCSVPCNRPRFGEDRVSPL